MILVTGANGFVGRALVSRLAESGAEPVIAGVRAGAFPTTQGVRSVELGDLATSADLSGALKGVRCVIHAAARAHLVDRQSRGDVGAFRAANVDGTLALARQAASAGVQRFVFVSSIKVNGEGNVKGVPYRPDDIPRPEDAYGASKAEAESGLRHLVCTTGMELVIVRPPLVYGPGVRANFRAMMSWLRRGLPLPLAGIDNRRSLVALDNLVDLLLTCTIHPRAAGEIFLVSDGEDLSTPQLLRKLAQSLGTRARLFFLPKRMVCALAAAAGHADTVRRLCGDLQADIEKTRSMLDWRPPVSVDQGLEIVARAFLDETRL